jgi:hypothetical protein
MPGSTSTTGAGGAALVDGLGLMDDDGAAAV